VDREKLVKLLAMTTSKNDHEALAALRMANKLLSAEKLTWREVLDAGGPNVRISIHRWGFSSDVVQAAEDWHQRTSKKKPT